MKNFLKKLILFLPFMIGINIACVLKYMGRDDITEKLMTSRWMSYLIDMVEFDD